MPRNGTKILGRLALFLMRLHRQPQPGRFSHSRSVTVFGLPAKQCMKPCGVLSQALGNRAIAPRRRRCGLRVKSFKPSQLSVNKPEWAAQYRDQSSDGDED